MNLLTEERTALFIDGISIYSTSRNLGIDIDYRALLEFFRHQTNLVRAYYYSMILESDEYTPVKPLTDWLSYNGFFVVSKAAKEYVDKDGKRRVKGSMEVELAVDMMEQAPRLEHIILFSGDAGFRRVLEAVQRIGCRVTVVSSMKASPPSISDELRRQCDAFIDLVDIAPNFTRKLSDRSNRETVDNLVRGTARE